MPSSSRIEPRRSERESASILITLVTRPEVIRQDEEATTIDTSLHGMRVRTALTLVPGKWVGVMAKGEFPPRHPCSRGVGNGG